MKICPVGAKLFHAGRQMDRQTKLVVAFRNFVNAPKNGHVRKSYDGKYWEPELVTNECGNDEIK